MSSMVTDVNITIINTSDYAILSIKFGLVAVLLLIGILTLREMVRNLDEPRVDLWMKTSDIVVVPLLIVFVAVLATRFVYYVDAI